MEKLFSVAMSVYKNDNPSHFKTAMESIYHKQTLKPSEIILIIDGPISDEMQSAINDIQGEIPIMNIILYKDNQGHAAARQGGLENSSNELIAIMDSDDIAEPERFEKQMKTLESHPEATVIGSLIDEFIEDSNNIVGRRSVPETDLEIKDYLKRRCPMNLQTVMYRKSRVMKVGGFMNWFCEEDYYLWIRLAIAGHKFYNIQEPLVKVRVGKEMYQRRGGLTYFKSEARLQKYMLDYNIIGKCQYLYNITIRWIVQVAMPYWLRGWIFRKFTRSKVYEKKI